MVEGDETQIKGDASRRLVVTKADDGAVVCDVRGSISIIYNAIILLIGYLTFGSTD